MGLGYINFYATVEIHIKRCAIELDWGKSGVDSAVLLSFPADEKKKQYKHLMALDDETKIPELQQLSLLKCQNVSYCLFYCQFCWLL